ncbi:MFS transporter [Haloarcula marina]|uniref:MFS transporter n=1 Tax=Haloarcula marina TaxID=2961574 RepID=UPI0020B8F7AD|nr:MFS transporter [Halomicroarcula marina]
MAVTDSVRRTVADLRTGHPARLLGAVAAGWFLVLGMRFVIPAILPTISDEFGVSNAAAGLAVTVLWLTYAVMQFPTGALIDRVGERTLLVAGAALSGTGLLAYFVSPTFALFLLATAAFGLGTGLYGPTRGTVLSRTFDAREGTAFGAVMAAGSVGAAALPFLAAAVTIRYGWRVALAGAAPLFFVVAVALWLSISDRPTATDGRHLLTDLRSVVAGIRHRGLLLAVVGATLMLFAFQAVTAFLTTYLVTVKTLDQSTAGALLSVLFVGGAVSQSVTGRLADRYGSPSVLTAVALVSAVPLALLPRLEGEVALAAGAALVGIRMSAGPLSNAYIVDTLPDSVEGTGWGLLRTCFFAIGSLGSTVVGVLADRSLFDTAFYLLAALTLAAAVVYFLLPKRDG